MQPIVKRTLNAGFSSNTSNPFAVGLQRHLIESLLNDIIAVNSFE